MQALLSAHEMAVPPHWPLLHASLRVHRLPSSQLPVRIVKTQPVDFWQVSVVQLLSSLQTMFLPSQASLLQASFSVQALPSSQSLLLGL